jgi:hypothetical protein
MNDLDHIRAFRADIAEDDAAEQAAREIVRWRLRTHAMNPPRLRRTLRKLAPLGLIAAVLSLGGILTAVFIQTPKNTTREPAAVAQPAQVIIVRRGEVPVLTKIVSISPERARLARSILNRLGPYNHITRLNIGPARAITAHLDPTLTGRQRAEAGWTAHLVLEDLSRALIASGWQPSTYGVAGDYSLNAKPTPRAPTIVTDPAKLVKDLTTRATAGDFALREVVVVPVDGGAVRVTLQLREDQLLDETAHDWLSALLTPTLRAGGKRVCVITEAADGRVVDLLCNGWAPGGDLATPPDPDSAVPSYWDGPTRLDSTITTTDFTQGGKQLTRSEHIDCTTTPPSGSVSDPAGLCDRVLKDRWTLFTPIGETICSPSIGGPSVTLKGSLGGHSVTTTYDGCYGAIAARWIRVLDNPGG